MTGRNGYVEAEDLEELSSDTANHPGIQWWVRPPDLSLQAPALSIFVVACGYPSFQILDHRKHSKA